LSGLSIFYGRVSTDQIGQDSSAKRQVEIGESGGYDIVLVDRESGRDIGRQEYTKLIDLIRDGKVEKVTATRSDRIGRNAAEMDYFYNLCAKHKVAWFYLDEPQLNSDSPWGHTQRKEAAHAAEMESIKLGLRQAAAYLHAEAKGRVVTRIIPLGLRVTPDKKFEVDWLLPDQSNAIAMHGDTYLASAEIARKLIDLYFELETMSSTHYQWIEWLESLTPIDKKRIKRIITFRYESIKEWFTNPAIRGHMAYGRYEKFYEENQSSRTITAKYKAADPSKWRIIYDTHKGLVDAAEAKEIDRLLKLNSAYGFAIASATRKSGTPPTLSPILRCQCGRAVNVSSQTFKDKNYRYYYCSIRPQCRNKGANEAIIVPQIIEHIGLQADKLLGAVQSAISGSHSQDSDEIRKLKAERDKVIESFKATGMKIFLDAEQQLSNKISLLEATPTASSLPDETAQEFLNNIRDPNFWWSMPPCDRHNWFRKIVRVARLEDGHVVSVELSL
jgi:site-specific DNA recombinase